jgi:hypothetical protein
MLVQVENEARICRITCGWKKPELPLDAVRRYWRDVHSPAIARRAGIWDYRHYQFDTVDPGALGVLAGVGLACPLDAQLMWLSDVRYVGDAALEAFGRSPDGDAKAQLLADIELIVDRSTTYKAVDSQAMTYVDRTTVATPQGTPSHPTFALFFRRRSPEPVFREWLRLQAVAWSARTGVRRLRLSLLDAPDMEAERRSGYPIKTHPVEQQYHAWIDLTMESTAALRSLVGGAAAQFAEHVAELHAYPVAVTYTSVYAGRPTLVGLRGYPAYEAIRALQAANACSASLLQWMYGPIAADLPLEVPPR